MLVFFPLPNKYKQQPLKLDQFGCELDFFSSQSQHVFENGRTSLSEKTFGLKDPPIVFLLAHVPQLGISFEKEKFSYWLIFI